MYKSQTILSRDVPSGFEGLTFDGGNTYTEKTYKTGTKLIGFEEIESFSHPGYRNALGRGGDIGGPFQSTKKWYSETQTGPYWLGNSYWDYRGRLSAYGAQGYPAWWTNTRIGSSNDLLFALGGTAVSRTIPTNPVGGAAVFLGELRQEFPHLVGKELFKSIVKEHKVREGFKSSGSEYLNVEFGWKPFVSDLQKFAKAIVDHDKILAQLHRDSGRNVRRRYKFPKSDAPKVVGSERINYAVREANGDGLPTYIYMEPGQYTWTENTVVDRWFSGCYTYHLPDYNQMFGVSRYVSEANKLLGVELTPSVVWNLAPWSWAADWFANTGDVFRNLTEFSQNDLVMRYGYIMETVSHTMTLEASQRLWTRNGPIMASPSCTFGVTSKTRRNASPFGFGLTWDGFNPRQLAITAALGISRH